MTPEQLTAWLKDIGESRQWLATEMSVSVRTVEKWFAVGRIPTPAQRTIELIREIKNMASTANPRFTPEEFESITAAAEATGCDSVYEFIQKATIRLAEDHAEYKKSAKQPSGSEEK